ncbi:D-sedoheptulose-7-phosphate isomerase [Plantactinospora endophytica]|uniref:Phosphoheptose isomerase n=1 Tax=Plantactinospora endophytica TaxID=673535 RepID=A0ABQ4DZS9_9ACTN|nr:SIS domain-containing protein [Plantactinospora endophytica]GIG87982.1 phosphoheptose isomerase [Plantactinospora endophytica]
MTAPDALALYPFLRPGADDPDALLTAVTRSTVEKVRQIVTLREQVRQRYGPELDACGYALAAAFRSGARLYAFGNGGSGTDAASVAQLFLAPDPGGRALPATSLTADVALLSALGNDVGFDVVFARQLAVFGRRGDIAVGLSTSGGSTNVLDGFTEARRLGMLTVGLAGSGGGRMAEAGTVDHLFVVPSSSVHRIQEAQTTVYHVLWELVQQALAGPG